MIPDELVEPLRSTPLCQFATRTARGNPINTELMLEVGDDLTLDVSTGLAYPAKADRARRDPRVGLWIELADGRVLSVTARAAVRDGDIAANGARYVARQRGMIASLPGGDDPATVASAVWYWSRIYVECVPVSIAWWPSADELDHRPQRWRAEPAPDPRSDPAPSGSPTRSGAAAPGDWRERAAAAVESGLASFLTTVDGEGYPRPVPATVRRQSARGFEVATPAGVPAGSSGAACLTFGGMATFLGELDNGMLTVERMLPDLVLVTDVTQILRPDEATRTHLMSRLETELTRRGQAVPGPLSL